MPRYQKINAPYKRNPDGSFRFDEPSIPEFSYLEDLTWVWHEKVDGTNLRIGWHPDEGFSLAGRGDNSNMFAGVPEAIESLVDHDRFLAQFPLDEEATTHPGVCLYGEGYGAGIQKGGSYRPDKSFALFDVRIGSWWLMPDQVRNVGENLGIGVAPLIDECSVAQAISYVETGLISRWGNFTAEGLVGRPKFGLKRRNGERILMKVKAKDFRLRG
jgi:hypothetical protein